MLGFCRGLGDSQSCVPKPSDALNHPLAKPASFLESKLGETDRPGWVGDSARVSTPLVGLFGGERETLGRIINNSNW